MTIFNTWLSSKLSKGNVKHIKTHLIAVKRIFKYLVGTPDLGLAYSKGSCFDLIAYCDADYAGDKIERKSTNGTCQFLGNALISWLTQKTKYYCFINY